jgi:hypothetical protein
MQRTPHERADVDFDFVLKGRGCSRALSCKMNGGLQAARNSASRLILGGAALQRCDNCIIF